MVSMAIDETHRFGLLLRRHRRGLRLTQAELAERAGYSVVYISMLERGARQPQAATVVRLAEVLELAPTEREAFCAVGRHAPPPDAETAPARGRAEDDAPPPVGHYLGAQPEGPLVGRETEWGELVSALDAAGGRQGRLVLLAGEPGIGKTRLAQEVCVAARDRGFLVATGRSYEPQRTVAFYPFLEALSRLHAGAPAELQEELPRRWPEAEHLLPAYDVRLAWAPGGSMDDREDQRIFWHVSAFVQALAARRPVAILLDDLHWADAASVDLLVHLARHTRTSPVLLLGTYRQQEVERHSALEVALRDLGREELAQRVSVGRLAAAGTAALVAASLDAPTVAPRLVTLLHRRTDGNPFFIREVVRALLEQGHLSRGDGLWEGDRLDEATIPESVRSLIDQRVERLGDEAHEILRWASVLGQAFAFTDLAAMGPEDEEVVERALETAVAAGLLRERARDGYAFDHALIQQALYAGLPSRRRLRLHRAAGEALERLPERARERRAGEMAWHFAEGNDPERALTYALRAGDQSAAVYGYAEAERHYRVAVELARELEDEREAAALEKLGWALHRLGRGQEAVRTFHEAAERYRVRGDIEGLARSLAQYCHLCWPVSGADEEIGRLRSVLATYGAAGLSAEGQGAVYLALAKLLRHEERTDETLEAARRAAELGRAAGNTELVVHAAMPMWTALTLLQRKEEAAQVLAEASALAEVAGDARPLSDALNQATFAALLDGELDRARRSSERALETAEVGGDASQIAFMRANRGEALFYTGDWTQTAADHERALALWQPAGIVIDRAFPVAQLGRLALARGDIGEAERQFEEVRELVRRGAHPDLLALPEIALAERDLVEGRAEAARARLEPFEHRGRILHDLMESPALLLAWAAAEMGDEARAEALLAAGSPEITAPLYRLDREQALRVRAVLELRQGRWEEAERALDEALGLSRAMGYPYAEARALYLLGEALAGQGEPDRARERFMEALAICGRLGERLYAGHIERALAKLPAWHQAARRRVS
jgi:tetratricopeptide (TPR) repeat protein/transcriptional regulator with XRE-family HTH domain